MTRVPDLDELRPHLDRALAIGWAVWTQEYVVVPVEVVDRLVVDRGLDLPPPTKVAERWADGRRCYVYRNPRARPRASGG